MADGLISISIKEIDLVPTEEDLNRRIERGQRAFGGMVVRDATNYVPQLDGGLRGSGKSENGGKQATWESYSPRGYPYGVLQFYTQFPNYTTGGTGPRWDLKATGLHSSAWVNELGGIMK